MTHMFYSIIGMVIVLIFMQLLLSVFLKTVSGVQAQEPDQVPEFRTTMNKKLWLKSVYDPTSTAKQQTASTCMAM